MVLKEDPYSVRTVPLVVMVRLPISANVGSYTTNSGAVLVGFTMVLVKMQKGFVKKEVTSKPSAVTGDWKFPVGNGANLTSEVLPQDGVRVISVPAGAAEFHCCRRSTEKNGVMQERAPSKQAYLEQHRFVRRQCEIATEMPRVTEVT